MTTTTFVPNAQIVAGLGVHTFDLFVLITEPLITQPLGHTLSTIPLDVVLHALLVDCLLIPADFSDCSLVIHLQSCPFIVTSCPHHLMIVLPSSHFMCLPILICVFDPLYLLCPTSDTTPFRLYTLSLFVLV